MHYEVESCYSFWGEEDSCQVKAFDTIVETFDFYLQCDHIDTSHVIFRVYNGVRKSLCPLNVERNLYRF